jgi:radical SAM superfamily enzyme YgiQ (UPF0313 family)
VNIIKVLIVSIAAKNIHKALAPWCLKAYADQYASDCEILIQESNVNENIGDIVAGIYSQLPNIIGLSTYIWNVEAIRKISETLKKLLPSCIIVLGGPEVSFEKSLDDYPNIDYIIRGPGETAFCGFINSVKLGQLPANRIIKGNNHNFCDLPTPYTEEYFDSFRADRMVSIKNQLVYYESSRGCPFSCAYCLSCSSRGVQYLPLTRVKEEIDLLLSHGAKCIKFVDRTFNADKSRAAEILNYILKLQTDCTFHFEAAADLFDLDLLDIISAMPVNRVQFEIGIQSVNPQTLSAVARKTDTEKALSNIRQLIGMKNCHIHVDLIAGLPIETTETFAKAMNQCLAARPHMLQLGFLKMLKGSAIREHSDEYDYMYCDYAPYEVLRSNTMSAGDIFMLKCVERVIDKFYNSGMFINSLQYAAENLFDTEFELYKKLSDYCSGIGNIKVSLKHSYTILLKFLLLYGNQDEAEHYIKLDCLTFDVKGLLPDSIARCRNKDIELQLKAGPEYKDINIRVEHFRFDNKKRLFIYDGKDPVSKAFRVMELLENGQIRLQFA